jgi:small GTP-binding protein
MAPGRRKFVCVGDESSGKTAFLSTYVGQPFPHKHQPTISSDTPHLAYPIKGGAEVELYDTPGSEELDRLRPVVYENVDVWIICFAIDSRQSLINVYDKVTD